MSTLLGAPRGAIVSLVVFSFFTNLLMLTIPLYMLQVFDRVLSSRSVETLLLLTLVAGAALLTSAFLETIRSRLLLRLGNRVYGQWGKQLLTDGGSGFSGTGFARLRDLGEIKQFVANGGLIPLLDIPWIPIYLVVLFLFSPLFAWAAVGGGLIISVIIGMSEIRTRKQVDGAVAENARTTLQADVLTKGADTIRALGMIERISNRWQSQAFSGMRQIYDVSASLSVNSSAARFVRMSLQIGVLGGAAYLVTEGELTPGLMIAGSILITRALGPLESMIGGWQSIASSLKAYRRLQAALQAPHAAPVRVLTRPAGAITLDKVTLIQDRKTLLNNVTCKINPGEMIAIEGPCGSGKSALARIMLGTLQPTLGKVFLDDVDIGQFNPDDLGHYLGYLAQDAPLFQGSVGENIGRMDPTATPEQIATAGRRAFAHDRILRLADGYETPVENVQISRGIRQRIALARALYGEPRLIVLDEPETYLDAEGERALLQTLTALKKTDITTIVVTHRPQILTGVDRVLRLKDGVVQAFGPVSEVLPRLALEQPRRQIESAPSGEAGSPIVNEPSPQPPSPQPPSPQPPSQKVDSDNKPPPARPGAQPGSKDEAKTAPLTVPPADAAARKTLPAREQRPANAQARGNSKPSGRNRRERRKVVPEQKALTRNRDSAADSKLTLGAWLDPKQGALGIWIKASSGRIGGRYLSRLRKRLEPMLALPLQEIDSDTVSEWRKARVGGSDCSIIERAMQKRRFDSDMKVLRECLSRAVEWQVLSDHVLLPAVVRVPEEEVKALKAEATE